VSGETSYANLANSDDPLRHLLGNIARVVGRDASRASAQVGDLYVALSEDETIYGLFKTMKGMLTLAYNRGSTASDPALANQLHIQSRNKSSARAKARVVLEEVNRSPGVRTHHRLARLLHNLQLLPTSCAPYQLMPDSSGQDTPRPRPPTKVVR
jgi:hypothetical protein